MDIKTLKLLETIINLTHVASADFAASTGGCESPELAEIIDVIGESLTREERVALTRSVYNPRQARAELQRRRSELTASLQAEADEEAAEIRHAAKCK